MIKDNNINKDDNILKYSKHKIKFLSLFKKKKLNIYVCHPQSDCFFLSKLLRATRRT